MAFATHLGPWLLGTIKNTTGTTAGTVQNLGSTIVAQTNAASFGFAAINASLTGTAVALPPGALITAMQFITTTAYVGGAVTVKLTIGATDIVAATTVTTAGVVTLSPVASAAVAALIANVGSTDTLVTYTATEAGTLSAGAGTLVIAYIVRGSDGAMYPTPSQQ